MLLAITCDDTVARLCGWLDPHDPTGTAVPLLQFVALPLVVLVIAILLGRIIRGIIDRAIRDANGDPQIRTLVHNVATVLYWSAGLLAALTKAGLSITVLLTFGGVASLAVGLAFQDLLRNVLAGIFLLIEHPFRIGDLVTIGEQAGTVQTISLRTTALRTADGKLAVLPNLAAFNGTIINSSAYDVRQYAVRLRLPMTARLDVALRRARKELAALPNVAVDPPPAVVPHLDPTEGATLECKYWVDYRSHDADAVTADVVRRLYDLFGSVPAPDPAPRGAAPPRIDPPALPDAGSAAT